MDETRLLDLYNSCKTTSFNVVFHTFKNRQTMNFNDLSVLITEIIEYLRPDIPAHSVIGCLLRPGLALPSVILGFLKISSPFMFFDVQNPALSLKSLQKYVPCNAILVEEELLKNFKEQLCSCWKRKETVILSALSPLVLLKSSGCSSKICPTSKVYPNFCGYASKLAYIIQTSGTTGEEKIVQVPHQCIVPNITDLCKKFHMTSKDVLLLCSPLTFDPSMVEIFLAILSGCTLVIVPNHLKSIPKIFSRVIVDNKTTVLQLTPSLLRSFEEKFITDVLLSKSSTLRVIAFGGEVCPPLCKLKKWISQDNKTQLFNLYGVTEVSCWASCQSIDLSKMDTSEISLGEPLLETKLELDDEGEILIGGQKRFCLINDEVWPDDNFMRRTGDFAIKNNDGLFLIGRKDKVIKYKGSRLSLKTINNILESIPEVLNHHLHFDHKLSKLYLFIVQDVKIKCLDEIRNKIVEVLQRSIPNLPAIEIRIVPYIPLTKHGKSDHRKLFEFANSNQYKTKDFTVDNCLKIISDLWKRYTNQVKVSGNDNFIMSGGDSFSAVQFASNVEWELQINAPELVEKILNDSFEDVVKVATQCLPGAKRPSTDANSVSCNAFSHETVLKKARLDTLCFECFEMATRRGYSVMCNNAKHDNCLKKDLQVQDKTISMRFRCKFDLKKCVDASPCAAYFLESGKLLAFIGSHSGLFCCINVGSNHLEWTTALPDRIESSACVSSCGEYVVVGCYDHRLYGFEIKTGDIRWSLITNEEIKSSPVISTENVAFVCSRDKYLYAVKAYNGDLVWKKFISKGSIFSSPALSKDMAHVAVATLDGILALLRTDTGTIVWIYNHGKPLFSSPIFNSTSILVGSVDDCLLKVNLLGKLVWKHETCGPIFSSPISDESLDSEHIVFGCHDCKVYCIGALTEWFWTLCCDSSIYAVPFIFKWSGKTCVVIACTLGDVYILDLSNGDVMCHWKCPGPVYSSPVVLNNILIIGCRDNNVYTLDLCDET